MAVPTFVNGFISDTAWVPWVLFLTTFAVWGAWSILSNFFGGMAARASGAAVGAGAGGVVAGAPGAAVGGVAGAAATPWYGRTHDTRDALENLLWLIFVPLFFNQFFGWEHTARNLIIAIFVLGMFWAFLRGLFHRFADVLWIPLIAMSVAAAAIAIRGDHQG